MIDSSVFSFTLIAAVLTITPGADTMLVLRNVLKGSKKNGIVTTFGICSGLFVHALLSGFGVSVVLMHSAKLFTMVKLAGAFYLIWLGWQSIRKAIKEKDPSETDEFTIQKINQESYFKSFFEGFMTNILNPKVAIFYLAFLPQFIKPGDPVIAKSILLAGIHYAMGILWLISLSVFLDYARQFIIKKSVRRWLDASCGSILMGLGIHLVLEDRKIF